MANFVYESVPNTTFKVGTIYSRDISVEKAALDVMQRDYQTNKPVANVEIPNMEMNVASANPFSNTVYPTEGITLVVQNMDDVPVASQIAPGISEVANTNFQTVQALENPVDLMVNNNQVQPVDNIVSFPQGDMMMNQVPNTSGYNEYQQPVNMYQNVGQVQMPMNDPQPVTMPQMEIDEQLQALMNSSLNDEQTLAIISQKITAIIQNYTYYIGMKKQQELQVREEELNKREEELNIIRQGLEARFSGQFSMQQPMMNNQMMNSNMQPMYPTQQNMITENTMNNMSQPMMNGQVMQYPQQSNNGFRQVA